ncbi:hypothetical protein MRB53_006253 [Persea americana]|uniref:Uncharacterized protein n=1 Tax=Persea americana TaxID=3435 RepID=A0ACC2MFT1_PERAE|nr:hypothetical protein MRB53_006253 [Persea americana]
MNGVRPDAFPVKHGVDPGHPPRSDERLVMRLVPQKQVRGSAVMAAVLPHLLVPITVHLPPVPPGKLPPLSKICRKQNDVSRRKEA